jgi:hypothetical protein
MDNPLTTLRFPHYPENVPEELKHGEFWVNCDEDKVPLIAIPNGACFAASSTNPDTWRSYETALETYTENEHIAGVGRIIEKSEEYVGVDLDDVLDPNTGEISSWASTIVERLDSYAEISPSLTGVKIWLRASEAEVTRAYKKPGLEVYTRGRYFTVTGLPLAGEVKAIEKRGDVLQAILDEEFPKVDCRSAGAYNGPKKTINLLDLLERSGLEIFMELSDGMAERKYRVLCPWHVEHSDGDVTGTYTGQYDDGALFFVCHHAHCARRRWREFRRYLESLIFLGRAPHRGDCRGRLQ